MSASFGLHARNTAIIINLNAGVRVETVQNELPILIVDDFYADPDVVRADALNARFDQSIAFYPGRHAVIDGPALQAVIGHICRILNAVGDVGYRQDAFSSDFSIVTTRPSDMLGGQKHPHIDPTPILGLVYLNPANPVGTSFWENIVTGTRCIRTPQETTRHNEVMANEGKQHEPDGYIASSSPLWRKYHTIEGRYNRLVFYPGNFFHSIDIVKIPEKLEMTDVRLTQRFICQQVSQAAHGGAMKEQRT